MKERKLEAACMDALREGLPGCNLWKIHDLTTGGQPDLEVAWHGHTTKLEFKLLKRDENVHDKWEDGRQLITCVRYEQQTARCWVVAWRQPYRQGSGSGASTYIYRPTALLNRKVPPEKRGDTMLKLWEHGVAWYEGVRFDVVVNLIRETHML